MVWWGYIVTVAIGAFGYGFAIRHAIIASKLDAERTDAALSKNICKPIILGIRCDGCKYESMCCKLKEEEE